MGDTITSPLPATHSRHTSADFDNENNFVKYKCQKFFFIDCRQWNMERVEYEPIGEVSNQKSAYNRPESPFPSR